ncbi:MAG: ABC-2 family transporter protein [bacterium]|nr:ABC-2 family transporter protein [bacterium]
MTKYWAIFKIEVASMSAFRAQSFIWMMFDLCMIGGFPFIFVGILNAGGALGQWDRQGIISYYVMTALCTNLIWMHPEVNMSNQIREGKITNFLVKPHSYVAYQFLRECSWKAMRTSFFLPVFLLIFMFTREFFSIPEPSAALRAAALLPGAAAIIFMIGFLVACSAFWIEENSAVLLTFWMLSSTFSGFYIPLDLLPSVLERISEFLPWRYAIYDPIAIAAGRLAEGQFQRVVTGQLLWVLILYCTYRVIWHFGMRRYSAVGR